jgi:hypothetical protein
MFVIRPYESGRTLAPFIAGSSKASDNVGNILINVLILLSYVVGRIVMP